METRQEPPTGEPEYWANSEVKGAAVAAKAEEPYAKLIYRALMSAPDHAMALQEIYQWFRENTDKDIKKDSTEGRPGKNANGWQNTIRYNLSMNKAFVKREHKQLTSNGGDNGSTKAGESKKPTGWMLKDWAVENGVESTTKYRQKEPPGQTMGARVRYHPYNRTLHLGSPISAKVPSGREGDPSMNKISLRGRHYTHETKMPPTSHQVMAYPHLIQQTAIRSMCQSQSQSQQGYEKIMISWIERMPQMVVKQEYSPMTPDSNAFGFVLPEPSLIHAHVANSSSSTGSHGTTAYGLPSGVQSINFEPPLRGCPYGMVDVAGVYQGSNHNTFPTA
ncbi:hypothetical protein FOMA001_g17482 [Fusarium oxysporum f. sp. matthiolae]|nr:hypothetical protein FOMA001_g17482 [Fusarium oxysporum f. sp. matthiolae]